MNRQLSKWVGIEAEEGQGGLAGTADPGDSTNNQD